MEKQRKKKNIKRQQQKLEKNTSFSGRFWANGKTSMTSISFALISNGFLFFHVQIDGKKVSSIKDLIQEAQPEEEEVKKQQEVAEELKAFLMVGVRKPAVFSPWFIMLFQTDC